jgi:hypothetical protein
MLHCRPCTLKSTLLGYFLGYSGTSYNFPARTPKKTRVMCQTASSLVRYYNWAWRGRNRKHRLMYCGVLDCVCGAVAWQCVDQIRYIIMMYNFDS